MGWLVWMCLGAARDKSARSRIGGRVSSETYLAPQCDATKTPRIEDYLQPRGAGGYDVSENYLTGGRKGAEPQFRRCVSEYGPYWGYAEDHMAVEDFVSIEFPRARKSFSELLIETDTLENGPLALAAMAAAAERAVRSKQEGSSKIVTLEAASSEPASQPLPSISSLSKDHLEASNAVAAFRESRRKSTQQLQQQQSSSYISTLFGRSSSRKQRSLPTTRSRSFQTRPLSPVPEVLSLEEELRNRRKSDIATSTMKLPSSLPATTTSSKQDSDEWDDYVLVDRTQETISDAATSSIDARISGSSSEAASQDDVTSSSPQEDHTTSSLLQRDASSSLPQWDASSASSSPLPQRDASTSLPQWDASSASSSPLPQRDVSSSLEHEDESSMRTPVRDPVVTPEVFISPKTSTAELNFTRVLDMEPEERLIFGSLADHWEAAWATKRPAWDGKGIPNSTNKYREDQKVMWHAAPFEERLAQALASQQDSHPRRRSSFNGRTSRLAASRSDTSLQAH